MYVAVASGPGAEGEVEAVGLTVDVNAAAVPVFLFEDGF